jgi:hypothetical protein
VAIFNFRKILNELFHVFLTCDHLIGDDCTASKFGRFGMNPFWEFGDLFGWHFIHEFKCGFSEPFNRQMVGLVIFFVGCVRELFDASF